MSSEQAVSGADKLKKDFVIPSGHSARNLLFACGGTVCVGGQPSSPALSGAEGAARRVQFDTSHCEV
jgi:hypothetical protein